MKVKSKILIIDDERLLRWSVRHKCESWGYEVTEAASGAEARHQVRQDPPNLILLDVKLPDANGVELLGELRKGDYSGPVIMITADPKVEDVKTALRLGAFDYLSKPVNFDEVEITIANALETNRLRRELDVLRDQARRQFERIELVGTSPVMTKLLEFVHKVAPSEANVLLQGETGTGKDLIAQIIHQGSARRERPFVPVNCSAIPDNLLESELFGHERGAFTDAKTMKKGLFEVADQGTLFLDEVGDLPLLLQAKLLRTLENQTIRRIGGTRDLPVNVRVVAASNRNLERAVKTGEFRQDLFYRLGVIPVFIPPLRSRREDILALVSFFIDHFNRRLRKHIEGLTPEAEQLVLDYAWPGNVRELKNAIQRAMILEDGSKIRPNYLPFYSDTTLLSSDAAFPGQREAGGGPLAWTTLPSGRTVPDLRQIPAAGTSLDEVERLLVEQALRQAQGNQSRAARLLDISRDTIRYKIKKYGLNGDGGESEPEAEN